MVIILFHPSALLCFAHRIEFVPGVDGALMAFEDFFNECPGLLVVF